jgi:hypothetical protein
MIAAEVWFWAEARSQCGDLRSPAALAKEERQQDHQHPAGPAP